MRSNDKMKNIFADKASLILRKMIRQPDKKWVMRDFTDKSGVSLGMAQGVLEAMADNGYVERIKKGPGSYTLLTNKQMLIDDWLKKYHFKLNQIDTYYTPDKNILTKVKNYFKNDQYALTLHTGANLITSFIRTDQIYLYFNTRDWEKDVLGVRQKLELKELVRGGNFHIIRPHYKKSIFFNTQKIKGYRVASNLQLYLDLYNFQPRGREHAEYLKKTIEEKGKKFGQP